MSTSTTTTCKARQVSDQMSCSRCGYVWDVNDPEPPECRTRHKEALPPRDRALSDIKRILG